MVKVGSILWRLRNYGFIAVVKYIITDKFKLKKSNYHGKAAVSVFNLNKQLQKYSEAELEELENLFNKNYTIVSEIFDELKQSGIIIKSDIIGSNADDTKFKVLNYLINSVKFDCILETGTQHGSTALFLEQVVLDSYPLNSCTISTFDVKTNIIPKGLEYVEYITLSTPVRKNLKIQTKRISNNKKNILFFHDSDHSYENMKFEFEWAWEVLKVSFIVSDDINGNNAFKHFALSKNLIPIVCKFGSGPAVGVLSRSSF
jgi:cephalosporin hydroxylase